MFSSSMFKISVFLLIFLRHVIADSNPDPGLEIGGDLPSSVDSHPDVSSRNRFTDASPSLPTNAEHALLLSEQASSLSPLENSDNVGSLIGAKNDGCSSAAAQLSNKIRRVKRDKGICDAIQDTKKSDPITQPGREQRGGQENDGEATPSSKQSPSPKPLPRPLKSGGADELCLSLGFYYQVCAPAYLESKIPLITYNLDQCRLSMGLECDTDETSFCCGDIKWNQPSLPSLSLPLFTTAFYTHTGYQCEKIGYTRSGRSGQSPWYWPF